MTSPGEGTFIYEAGSVIHLVAEAEEGFRFVQWSGDISTIEVATAAHTTIHMNVNHTVRAEFMEIPPVHKEFTLTIEAQGLGDISPHLGVYTYDEGTVVTLEAVPAQGWRFVEWVGSVKDSKSPTTTVIMAEDIGVTAVFEEEVEPEIEKTVIILTIGSYTAFVNDVEHLIDVAPF